MKELEKTGEAFEAEIVKDNLKEIIAELTIDAVQNIGENIPGLSSIFKIPKLYNSIKDYALIEKVSVFLNELNSMSKEQRVNLIEKINQDKIFGRRFGSFLLTAIDRHDFAEKSQYLARACKFYERGDISKSTLVLVNTTIENLHLVEIKRWMTRTDKGFPKSQKSIGYSNFFANGVIRMVYNFNLVDKDRKHRYSRNDLNQELIKTELTDMGIMLYHIVQDKVLNDIQKVFLSDLAKDEEINN